ncbi:MAG TPA: hypothetical protein VMV03_13660 [Spirochaetia bacterium]|nr:hypothetical protein [Spirochaetia bacterium]
MKMTLKGMAAASIFVLMMAGAGAAGAQARSVTCVGLYSETDAGYISSRVGSGDWVVVKVGDKIPSNAEIRVNVDRDWIEVTPSDNSNVVYEIHGPDSGEVIKKVSDLLKTKPKIVVFPKGTAGKPDPKFKNKLVVGPYLGRQVYTTADGDESDIKYGDVLDGKGKVRIIAINNTIELMDATRKVTKVIGPLNFDLVKVLTGQKLYKYLNAP